VSALDNGGDRAHRRRPQLNDEAADYVRQLIMSGQLQSGQYIRPEALAQQLEMSATPVREGLLSLRGEGFLFLEPRKGFVVAPLTADDIRDLFRVQALIAGELAYRACSRLEDRQVNELRGIQSRLMEAAEAQSADDMESYNNEFHRLINVAAGSVKLAWTLSVSTRNVPRRFYSSIPGWPAASMSEHSAIIDALQRRDPEASRRATEEHFDHAGTLLALHFEQMRSTLSA
jgi:DNA-binding GntR family transcriptional regulator